jgi:hypothetical protein
MLRYVIFMPKLFEIKRAASLIASDPFFCFLPLGFEPAPRPTNPHTLSLMLTPSSHHLSVVFFVNHFYTNEFKRISNERLSSIKKYLPTGADNGRNDPAA